jgi:hypothetical protein
VEMGNAMLILLYPFSHCIAYGGCCLAFAQLACALWRREREVERFSQLEIGMQVIRWMRKQVGDGRTSKGLPRRAVCARRERGTVPSGFFVLREICRFRLRARRLRAWMMMKKYAQCKRSWKTDGQTTGVA